jgi:hypothetical protein
MEKLFIVAYLIGFVCHAILAYRTVSVDVRFQEGLRSGPFAAFLVTGLYVALTIFWPFSIWLDSFTVFYHRMQLIKQEEYARAADEERNLKELAEFVNKMVEDHKATLLKERKLEEYDDVL